MNPSLVGTPDLSATTLAALADLPAALTVPEAAKVLRIGRNSLYDSIRRGDCPVKVLRVGRRELISTASLVAFLGVDVGS